MFSSGSLWDLHAMFPKADYGFLNVHVYQSVLGNIIVFKGDTKNFSLEWPALAKGYTNTGLERKWWHSLAWLNEPEAKTVRQH